MIYLDHNATTPIDARVLQEICQVEQSIWGNPSSSHVFGQKARSILDQTKREIASFFSVFPEEVFFTSCATEGLNTILRSTKGHIITSSLEHEAVFQTAKALEREGVPLTFLDPERGEGAIAPHLVWDAIREDTQMIALMGANNETGALTDIEEIAHIAQKKNIPFLVDGVALLGNGYFDIPEGVSAICFSGHKIHAPKGIGVMIVRKGHQFSPLITGGSQQSGKRGGTLSVANVVGLKTALHLLDAKPTRVTQLRNYLEKSLCAQLDDISVNFTGDRVGNVTNITFRNIGGETLVIALDQSGVAVSHGAACSSGAQEPSRVLLNMGLGREVANSSIRFSLSRMTTQEEIDKAVLIIARVVNHLRSLLKLF